MKSYIDDAFGSVPAAMLVLLQSTTGGADWVFAYDAIALTGAFTSSLFLFYILFFVFAFYNIVTSLFLEKAMKFAAPDMESMMLERRKQEAASARGLRGLIESLDSDHNGNITLDELTKLDDPNFNRFFELHDLNIKDAEFFFHTLTQIAKSETLDIGAFVAGCMKMRGPATNLDVQALHFQMQLLADDVRNLVGNVRQIRKEGMPSIVSALQEASFSVGGGGGGEEGGRPAARPGISPRLDLHSQEVNV